ncbi:30S ribosomal protein S3 [Labeo rohita]|uniref:30S ribosomal protein S3 n=1 Tax=Labeo rohita TaxID=84645 RepID=A0ABQ8N056_LABRO|nr:30S ribosomal protein S3 [Labeo rohita]
MNVFFTSVTNIHFMLNGILVKLMRTPNPNWLQFCSSGVQVWSFWLESVNGLFLLMNPPQAPKTKLGEQNGLLLCVYREESIFSRITGIDRPVHQEWGVHIRMAVIFITFVLISL